MRKHLLLFVLPALCLPLFLFAQAPARPALLKNTPFALSHEGPNVRIYSPEIKEPVKIFVLSDTHLFRSDAREDPYRDYSKRMAAAYNQTRDIRTREETNPEAEFLKTLEVYYLDADMNMQTASEMLKVHKNTIKYRINMVCDALGHSVSNPVTTSRLTIALAIRRLLDRASN